MQEAEFVMREQGSGTRELFEDFIRENHAKIYIKWEVSCFDATLRMVLQENCVGIASVRLVKEQIEDGVLFAVKNDMGKWDRTFCLVYHKKKFMSDAMRDVYPVRANSCGSIQAAKSFFEVPEIEKKEGFHQESLFASLHSVFILHLCSFCNTFGSCIPIGFCRPPHLRARLYYHIFTRKPAFPVAQVVTRRSAIRHHTFICFQTPCGYSVRYALAFVGALTGPSLRSCCDESYYSIAAADISKLQTVNLKNMFRDSLRAPQSSIFGLCVRAPYRTI